MENVLFVSGSQDFADSHKEFLTPNEYVAITSTETISPSIYYVCTPVKDKGNILSWLTSDPDGEEDLTFNKDFRLAFEFKDIEHARRGKNLIDILNDTDAIILGEVS